MPTEGQKQAIKQHCVKLREFGLMTPENDARYEAETLVIVTKLLLTLPGMRTSETGAEAKGEAYMAALDDVPSWAVGEAVRGWYRGTHPAPHVENGKAHPYDFSWAPAPAVLRNLAVFEAWKFENRAREVEKLLNVVEFDPTAAAHCEKMRDKIHKEIPWLRPMNDFKSATGA